MTSNCSHYLQVKGKKIHFYAQDHGSKKDTKFGGKKRFRNLKGRKTIKL